NCLCTGQRVCEGFVTAVCEAALCQLAAGINKFLQVCPDLVCIVTGRCLHNFQALNSLCQSCCRRMNRFLCGVLICQNCLCILHGIQVCAVTCIGIRTLLCIFFVC